MSTVDPTAGEVYAEIVDWLQQHNASEVASDIRNSVARGIVVTANGATGKVVREMNEDEKLAVALEFLVSILEVPLFIDTTRDTFGCQSLQWESESLSAPAQSGSAPIFSAGEMGELKECLQNVTDIAHKIGIALPEIA